MPEHVSLSSGTWLLYVEVLPNLDTLFTDVDIPFNCELLVAYPEDDFVYLNDVYRISSDLPLLMYRFGNWTSHGSLTWPLAGLYQRRNNLQGIKLKTRYRSMIRIKAPRISVDTNKAYFPSFSKCTVNILLYNRDIDNQNYLMESLRICGI